MKREETFGKQLKAFRALAGVSQDQLAAEMEMSHHAAPSQRDISLYEADKALPRADKFAALVDALDLTQMEVMTLVRLAERRKVTSSRREKSPEAEVLPPGHLGQPLATENGPQQERESVFINSSQQTRRTANPMTTMTDQIRIDGSGNAYLSTGDGLEFIG
jgi:transcriptional regulator with XRE-family HTH domain